MQFFTVRTKLPSTSSIGDTSAENYRMVLTTSNDALLLHWPLFIYLVKTVLPMSFLQETLNWSRSCMRFAALMFHLDLNVCGDDWLFDAVLSWLWQSGSVVLQNSRTYTGVTLDAATRAKTNALYMLHISTNRALAFVLDF